MIIRSDFMQSFIVMANTSCFYCIFGQYPNVVSSLDKHYSLKIVFFSIGKQTKAILLAYTVCYSLALKVESR